MSIVRNALLLSFLGFAVGGCGSGDSGDSLDFAVAERIVVSDETLAVGEGSVVGVSFSFDEDAVFNDNENVVLVIKLPNGVSYRNNTSELDTNTSDDSIGAQVTRCGDGSTYLVYDMDENDLQNATDPSDVGDARLKLTVDATAAVGFTAVEARARMNSAFFSCDSIFLADDITRIRVIS